MKNVTGLVLFASLVFVTPAVAEGRPAVGARQALELAEKDLAGRGLADQIFAESVVLERSALRGGEVFWFVRWSESLPARTKGRREVGVKVTMGGRVIRVVQ